MDWCIWNGINEMIKIFIKILEVNLRNSILNNFKWDKLSKGIAKIISGPYLEQCKTLSER